MTQWKKQAIESLPDVFSTRRERDAEEEEVLKAELYQQIGQPIGDIIHFVAVQAPDPEINL